ncbi:MAG: 4Fe-4S binding protein [Epulopiscium sp.]|nr:4Fe-4S binding protein [Candidatus Epulonipiscium sp.]
MKELLILSGKGGTGKTTVASAFIKLNSAKAYADCDVDAPNLHLITGEQDQGKREDYYGMPKAYIDQSLCIECDECRQKCRFNAVEVDDGSYKVNQFACEGCGVCEYVCPVEAVNLRPSVDGDLILYLNENRVFSTAKLKMGSGTSGLLVSQVKKRMKSSPIKSEIAIVDGSPGIGCPVIASLSGAHTVLIVAEPSLSGISDMERIIDTARAFGCQIAVCINKYDTNINNTNKIKEFCKERSIDYVGEIPFDSKAVDAINRGQTIVDVDCPSGEAVKEIYRATMDLLKKES